MINLWTIFSVTRQGSSPVVLLNRAIALSKVYGAEKAISALKQINDNAIKTYYLFYVTKAQFYIEMNQFKKAIENFEIAIPLAPLQKEKDLLQERLEFCLQKNF